MDISPKSETELCNDTLQDKRSTASVLSKVSIFTEQISQQSTSVHYLAGQKNEKKSPEKVNGQPTSVSRSWTVNSIEKKSVITRARTKDHVSEVKPSEAETPTKEDNSHLLRSKSAVTMRPKPTPRVSPGNKPVPVPRKRLSLERKPAVDLIEDGDSNCVMTSSMMSSMTSSMMSSMTSSVESSMTSSAESSMTNSMTSSATSSVLSPVSSSIPSSSISSSMTSSVKNDESHDFPNALQIETELDRSDADTIVPMDITTPPPIIPEKQNTEEVKSRYVDLNKSDDDTSSLLKDIEKIITEAFDVSPNARPSSDTSPVRPPRRKRQCCYPDSMEYNSDSEFSVLKRDHHKGSTQSLNALETSSASSSGRKPCPPKPIRTKLASGKSNRSQSDLGDIRQLVLMKESVTTMNQTIVTSTSSDRTTVPQMRDKSTHQFASNRGNSCILTPDTRVPANQEAIIREKLKDRSKSLPASRCKKGRPKRPAPPPPVPGTKAPPIDDQENAYIEIPETLKVGRPRSTSLKTTNSFGGIDSPPELPPRNEVSSRRLSAVSQDSQRISPTSSRLLDPSDRPNSIISIQSDSGSMSQGSPAQGSSSSEDESVDQETRKEQKRKKKIRFIAREMASSERVFVDVLKLLNIDFRLHISKAEEEAGKTIVPKEYIDKILSHLPQLQNFNEVLLKDMESRIDKWDECQKIADIFVQKGPFLKLYTSYMTDFSDMTAILDEALKKIPQFQTVVKEFEMSPRCACLSIRQHMLKPIQRIPQYKLLLQDYFKHLTPDSPDYEDTKRALEIVSKVAEQCNNNMKQGDQVQRMLEIQKSLDGNFEIIKPGRLFIKAGVLMKLSRKEMQERMFFLFSDVLLYTTPTTTGGYRLNQVLTLTRLKVSMSTHDEFSKEFNIISTHKSFTVEAKTLEDRNAWITALTQAVEENALKRNTFEKVQVTERVFKKGEEAPVWIPDSRVTMCMMCTSEFSVIHRRHHCRACGKVLCHYCSMYKVPLKYLDNKVRRVCNDCYSELKPDDDPDDIEPPEPQNSKWFFPTFLRKSNHKRPHRFLEVPANDQVSQMSGNLKVLEKGKWKKYWFVLKDKVLYYYGASRDVGAKEIKPVIGYEVEQFKEIHEGVHQSVLFQLRHQNQKPNQNQEQIVFQGENASITERWIKAMKEASVP
ncbi:LOW QUALITY PROTEIN: FYVE, RhoGEF and PH domain-containing protein 6-like [Argopecten irradians]|uniref:LOW QUALITY PROTEIN: FYVE, RhoGEF and PH domain-containing protein 6-like n=1 Tax=Argopecten irradians TaxID=31199 RepID=UPI00371B67C5